MQLLLACKIIIGLIFGFISGNFNSNKKGQPQSKKFPSIPAISSTDASFLNQDGISIEILENHLKENLPNLLSSFATIMPYWVKSSFFNPEFERSRLEIHDYQQDQTSTKSLRKMENCKLVDEIEQKL